MYARTKDGPWLLYDLENDPYELRNLAEEPEAREVLEEMEARVRDWMQQTGDSWDFDWTDPIEDRGRLYRHDTFYTVDEFLEWAKEHPELAEL